jgi:putative transposase
MARLPRLIVPSQPHYLIQRGANGQPIFQDAADYAAFLAWLRTGARTFKVAIHAYALLPDQLHLLVSPADTTGLGQLMQWLGRYYVPYYNQKYGRSGSLWGGRYKTSLIDPDNYLLACSRYLEWAPVRQGLVPAPLDYPWSSHAHHVGTQSDGLITDHALFWALGNTPFDREVAYRALNEQQLDGEPLRVLEQAVLKGWPLGSEQFKKTLEKRMQRQVLPAKRGRPFKTVASAAKNACEVDLS